MGNSEMIKAMMGTHEQLTNTRRCRQVRQLGRNNTPPYPTGIHIPHRLFQSRNRRPITERPSIRSTGILGAVNLTPVSGTRGGHDVVDGDHLSIGGRGTAAGLYVGIL